MAYPAICCAWIPRQSSCLSPRQGIPVAVASASSCSHNKLQRTGCEMKRYLVFRAGLNSHLASLHAQKRSNPAYVRSLSQVRNLHARSLSLSLLQASKHTDVASGGTG
ncbi:hypothetical protein U9M48_032957 [Paspalum notatum var. saurae]|uniref:Uncharacterized protein n=1 Tax=Paspalum notatum var. saurae TaxID=547442 RepID=A0AAQ3U8B3_PASNO